MWKSQAPNTHQYLYAQNHFVCCKYENLICIGLIIDCHRYHDISCFHKFMMAQLYSAETCLRIGVRKRGSPLDCRVFEPRILAESEAAIEVATLSQSFRYHVCEMEGIVIL